MVTCAYDRDNNVRLGQCSCCGFKHVSRVTNREKKCAVKHAWLLGKQWY